MSDYSINVVVNGVEQSVSTIGELEEALKATNAELKQVDINSEKFEELSNQSRTLQREFQNLYKEGTNFNRNLGQLTESATRLGSTITSGFAAAQSIMALMGNDTKDLSEAQVKAQQMLTVAMAATTIATNAAKLAEDARNVGMALQSGLIRTITTLTGAQAAVTGEATVAQTALNAVMKANPIGILITAITALVGAYALFSEDADDAVSANDKLNKSFERSVEVSGDVVASTTKIISARKEETRLAIELAKINGQISEANAKSQLDKLNITQKVNEEVNKLTKQQLEFELKQTQEANKKILIEATKFVETARGIDINKPLGQLPDTEESLIKSLEMMSKSSDENRAKNAAKMLSDIQKVSSTTITKLKNDLTIAEKEATAATEKGNADRRKIYEDHYKELAKLTADKVASLSQVERDALTKLEDMKLSDDITRQGEKIELEYKRTDQELKIKGEAAKKELQLKGATNEQLKQLDDQLTATRDANAKLYVEKLEQNNRLQVLYAEIANEELTFGDLNYFDSKDKIASEFAAKYAQLRLNEFNAIKEEGFQSLAEKRARLDEELALTKDLLGKQADAQSEAVRERYQNDINKRRDQQAKLLTEDKKGHDAINAQIKNLEKQKNDELSLISAEWRQKEKEADQSNLQERAQLFEKYVREIQSKVSDYSATVGTLISAAQTAISTGLQTQLAETQLAYQAQTEAAMNSYNAQVQAQKEQLTSGVINRDEYNKRIKGIDDNLKKQQLAAQQKQIAEENKLKQKAFEQEKNLKIAQTIIATIQGALSAFTGAMQLGPIAGPIVGGILAATVTALGAVSVANIAKQKFVGTAMPVQQMDTNVDIPEGTSSSDAIKQASSGGFTKFQPSLVGAPTGPATTGTGTGTNATPTAQPQYVVSVIDINAAQQRVDVLEGNASF